MHAVTPHECALAIALPLTERRFLEDLRAPEHDYAAYIRSLHLAEGAEDSYYWSFVYGPFAAVMSETCNRVAARGVTLVRDAKLADFGALAARFPIVTFVSHWRFRALRVPELNDFDALVLRLEEAPNALVRAIREALLVQDREALRDSHRLVNAFNSVLRTAHSEYVTDRHESVLLMKIPPQRLTRSAIEKAFPDFITPAPAVEFADGMKTTNEVVDAIPLDFAGLLDLTVCNSAILGDIIKAARPSCTVAVNRYPTEPHIRLVLYHHIIDELARRTAPFAEAMACFGKRQ
jgi:hypothetical protein